MRHFPEQLLHRSARCDERVPRPTNTAEAIREPTDGLELPTGPQPEDVVPLDPHLLTPHFSIREMTVTGTGLPNEPGEAEKYALKALCSALLEPWRETVGPIRITSAFRSPEVNDAVGGSSTSQHCRGEAADVVLVRTERVEAWLVLVRMAAHRFPIDQAIVYEDRPHIHVSHTAERIARRELLVHTREGTYVPWDTYRAQEPYEDTLAWLTRRFDPFPRTRGPADVEESPPHPE